MTPAPHIALVAFTSLTHTLSLNTINAQKKMLTRLLSRLCPMLNGTMKTDTSMAEHGGFGAFNGPSTAGSP